MEFRDVHSGLLLHQKLDDFKSPFDGGNQIALSHIWPKGTTNNPENTFAGPQCQCAKLANIRRATAIPELKNLIDSPPHHHYRYLENFFSMLEGAVFESGMGHPRSATIPMTERLIRETQWLPTGDSHSLLQREN